MSLLSLISILIVFGVSASQVCRDDISSCSSCLESSPQCLWCSNQTYTGSSCFERNSSFHIESCGERNVVDLQSNLTEFDFDMESSNVGSGDVNATESETLVSPDIIMLSTRANEVHKFNVTIRIPFNYPLDFYYLMDLSVTMQNDLENVQALSPQIIETLRNLTTNFRVGFGAFSDKEALPFTYERQTDEFCPERGYCLFSEPNSSVGGIPNAPFGNVPWVLHPPFDYIHYQSLTSNGQVFTDSISNLNVTINRDIPESVFDAMMQASVCPEVIGWRPTASHIILIATDAPYHIAGDGKLVGALRPNDMKCHMSQLDDGTYTYNKSLELDYPSAAQLMYALEEQRIVPIFALIDDDDHYTVRHFQDLREQLLPRVNSYIANLDDGSQNILNLIIESYNSLAQSISLSTPFVDGVNISVRPVCNQIDGLACVNVSRGDSAEFEVSVVITDCDAVEDRQNITLEYPFLAISVTIELTALCDCPCAANQTTNSSMCNYRGNLTCGRCQCDPTMGFGRHCECPMSEGVRVDPNIDQGNGYNRCPIHNDAQCNNHGNCTCNECECEEDYMGIACETQCTCDNNCGGPSNGRCTCNRETGESECVCTPEYTGDNCDCSVDRRNCTDNATGVECSNRGRCDCGMCVCEQGCFGSLCERCRDELLRCSAHRTCVQCRLSTVRAEVTRPDNCDTIDCNTAILIPPLNSSQSINYRINGNTVQRCSFPDGNCFYTFYIAVNDQNFLQPLHIEETLVCALSDDSSDNNLIWIIPVAIVAGLLVLGLIILLIIKLFLLILDYVEVRQFERAVRDAEGKLAQTSQPLYQSPVVEYQNLAYGIEKKDNK